MKTLLISSLLIFASGCATVGEMEVLNDVGLGDFREAVSIYNKTLNVLGYQSKTRSASKINTLYGHSKNMNTDVDNMSEVPYVIRDIHEFERYIK